jgi:hypothetical protein
LEQKKINAIIGKSIKKALAWVLEKILPIIS